MIFQGNKLTMDWSTSVEKQQIKKLYKYVSNQLN